MLLDAPALAARTAIVLAREPLLAELTPFQRSLELGRVYVKGDPPPPCQRSVSVRVLSWNLGQGHAPERLAETIVAIRPDIACLQEVDWGNRRTGDRDVLADLAKATGMLGVFGIEFLEVPSPRRPARFGGGGATGNALLLRQAPEAAFRVELPAPLDWRAADAASDGGLPSSVRRALQRERRIGRRFGIGADLCVGGLILRVCSVHFEDKYGGVAGRWAQFSAAAEALREETTACVIAGDFNTFDCRIARMLTADTDAMALGKPRGVREAAWWKTNLLPRTGYRDPFAATAWTFAVPPLFRAKLDWIAVRGGWISGSGVRPFASSDHRPVWVDLRLAEA